MGFDLGRVLSRSFGISWRHRWLWLLGVFGGAGGGANFGGNTGTRTTPNSQATQFFTDHLGLILVAVAVVVLIALVAFIISCVAVPASIWAGLQLDVGHEVGLGRSWREGRARFWRFLRLGLLKLVIGLGVVAAGAVVVLLGVAVHAAAGPASAPLLVLGGILLFLAFVVAIVLLSYGLLWSDRMLVLLDLGAADSIRAGWWLVRREKLNSVVFSVVFGIVKFVISLALLLLAVVVAVPGIVMLGVYFTNHDASVLLAIIGIAWVVVLGLGALLAGGGYLGALNQVGYALAARDLAIGKGMQVRPEVIGWDPYGPAATATT